MKTKAKVRRRPAAKPVKAATKVRRVKAKATKPAKPAPKTKKHTQSAAAPVPGRISHVSAQPKTNKLAAKQQEQYDEAMKLFYAQKYDRADTLFQKVIQGPDKTLAHHAQVHSNICASRAKQPQVHLKTPEDHYNYAVTMLNARRLEEATKHLEAAIRLAPKADHLHYALAAAHALQGNSENAVQRLKAAIDLEPQNRIRARFDLDFAGILDYPPLASLLHLDRRVEPE